MCCSERLVSDDREVDAIYWKRSRNWAWRDLLNNSAHHLRTEVIAFKTF